MRELGRRSQRLHRRPLRCRRWIRKRTFRRANRHLAPTQRRHRHRRRGDVARARRPASRALDVGCRSRRSRAVVFIAHQESPFVTELVESEAGSGRFVQPEPVGPHVMEVVIARPSATELTYAWWRAEAGRNPSEQSEGSRLHPSGVSDPAVSDAWVGGYRTRYSDACGRLRHIATMKATPHRRNHGSQK